MMMSSNHQSPSTVKYSVGRRIMLILLVLFKILAALYICIFCPPLDLFLTPAPAAGPGSVYIPGNGFSGFWFHLAFLQSLPNLRDYKYYCFSSGCLSTVLAYTNTTLDSVYDKGFAIQNSWLNGTMSRYDIVNDFVDYVLSPQNYNQMKDFLPNIHVIVSNKDNGVSIHQATNIHQLKDLLIKTTWIPYLTGDTWFVDNQFFDGGFSRSLHPKCEYDVFVPTTWVTFVHALNPSLCRKDVRDLWEAGKLYQDHPLVDQSIENNIHQDHQSVEMKNINNNSYKIIDQHDNTCKNNNDTTTAGSMMPRLLQQSSSSERKASYYYDCFFSFDDQNCKNYNNNNYYYATITTTISSWWKY